MCRVPTGRDAAGYDGRAAPIDREQAARPYRLEYVPIIIGKWCDWRGSHAVKRSGFREKAAN